MMRALPLLALGFLAADTSRRGSRFAETFTKEPSAQWEIARWGETDAEFHDPENGIYYLTRDGYRMSGAVLTAKRELTSRRWKARFRYRISGEGTLADGFVFFFYKGPQKRQPQLGGTVAFDGSAGYGVFFDTWPNAGDDPPSVSIVRDSVSNHLVQKKEPKVADQQWHAVEVVFDQGRIVVSIDGTRVLDYVEKKFDYTHSRFGFTAATGGAFADHAIDDFVLEY
jgi:hypothetical protein